MGYLYVFTASVFFALSPTMSALLQRGGWSNGAVLWNNELFGALYLFLLIRHKKLSLHISGAELFASAGLGGAAFWGTSMLLQASYHALPNPGIATVFHFTYPVFALLIMSALYRERITVLKTVCIAIALSGIFLIADISEMGMRDSGIGMGALLAIASGAAYSAYIIVNDKSAARNLHAMVLTFYVLIGGAVYNFVYLAVTKDFSVSVRGGDLLCALAVPICSFLGLTTIAEGVRRIGSTKASVINMLEPVISLLISTLVFQSSVLTLQTICGCGLILLGTGLIAGIKEPISKKQLTKTARRSK